MRKQKNKRKVVQNYRHYRKICAMKHYYTNKVLSLKISINAVIGQAGVASIATQEKYDSLINMRANYKFLLMYWKKFKIKPKYKGKMYF